MTEQNKDMNKYKYLIDAVFNKKEQENAPLHLTRDELIVLLKKGDEDVHTFETALNNFAFAVSKTSIYKYLESYITDLSDMIFDYRTILFDQIQEDQLSPEGKAHYRKICQLREQMLRDLQDKQD